MASMIWTTQQAEMELGRQPSDKKRNTHNAPNQRHGVGVSSVSTVFAASNSAA